MMVKKRTNRKGGNGWLIIFFLGLAILTFLIIGFITDWTFKGKPEFKITKEEYCYKENEICEQVEVDEIEIDCFNELGERIDCDSIPEGTYQNLKYYPNNIQEKFIEKQLLKNMENERGEFGTRTFYMIVPVLSIEWLEENAECVEVKVNTIGKISDFIYRTGNTQIVEKPNGTEISDTFNCSYESCFLSERWYCSKYKYKDYTIEVIQ